MGLKKLAVKIADYNERFDRGEASRIEPGHVEKTLQKLRKKSEELSAEISAASSPQKRERRIHIERAEWLLKELGA